MGLLDFLPFIGDAANAIGQVITNKKNRDFAKEQYSTQRKDALADTAFQNQYNSPAAQMERLKAAGLNPNLVYGQGATTVAASTRSSSTQGANATAPQTNVGRDMTIAPMIEGQKLQNDNLKLQGKLIMAQTEKEKALTPNIQAKTTRSLYDYDFLKTIEQNRIEKSYQEGQMGGNKNRQIQASTAFTNDENLRQAAMQAPNLRSALVHALQMEYNYGTSKMYDRDKIQNAIENIKNSNKIQEFELFMNQKGITKGDPAYLRMMRDFIYKALGNKNNIND